MKWLVLGLGNPLAGADGFGPAVIARLRRAAWPDGADFVDAHTDLLAHLHRFEHFDRVVLVDTVLDDRGGVAVIDEAEFSGGMTVRAASTSSRHSWRSSCSDGFIRRRPRGSPCWRTSSASMSSACRRAPQQSRPPRIWSAASAPRPPR
jgi:hypothetical protein